jgi:hypothetical protein
MVMKMQEKSESEGIPHGERLEPKYATFAVIKSAFQVALSDTIIPAESAEYSSHVPLREVRGLLR